MESQENKKFLPGTTFDEHYSMFQFDRHVRNILFKNLLIIENNIKSIMAFHLSSRYGIREDEYLNPKNFVLDRKRKKQVDDLLRKMKRQIRINGGQHQATMHYSEKYGYVPMWIAVKVLSFGIVSELFQILKPDDQETVANDFNLAKETLEIYLPVLANFRNLCAHEDILFEHKAQRNIPDTKYHNLLKIPQVNDEYIYGKNDIFAVIIMLKYLLRKEDFRIMLKEIDYEKELLDSRIDSIPIEKILDRMGIPKNYLDLLDL